MTPATAVSMIPLIAAASAVAYLSTAHAFVSSSTFSSNHVTTQKLIPAAPMRQNSNPMRSWNKLQMAITASYPDLEEKLSTMRIQDIRNELESYGVSTKSFFEKSELVEALTKARKEEKIPIDNWGTEDTASTNIDESSRSSGPVDNGDNTSTKNGWFHNMVDHFSNGDSNRSSGPSTKERIEQERKKCKKLKVKELKKELESYGVSTKSYFEKSEFERAVAETRVNGTKKPPPSNERYGARSTTAKEPWDPSYRDVVVTTFDSGFEWYCC
mmetsp:Transcript_18598/g.34454  ORF Transcript_18598/g.34454 Transcript_18598/m.34454 type:complete len:271 (+) Transcript_18598:5027-5839(+)